MFVRTVYTVKGFGYVLVEEGDGSLRRPHERMINFWGLEPEVEKELLSKVGQCMTFDAVMTLVRPRIKNVSPNRSDQSIVSTVQLCNGCRALSANNS